jgi:uncharacterized protein with GYD domain
MDIYAEILGSAINALKKETEEVEMPTFEEKLVEEGNDTSAPLAKEEEEPVCATAVTADQQEDVVPSFVEEEIKEEDAKSTSQSKEKKGFSGKSFNFVSASTKEVEKEPEKQPEKADRFTIDSDNSADWAIRKIAEEEKEYLRLCKIADEEIRMLQEKKERLKANFDKTTKHLKNLLAEYFQTVDRKKTTTKETYQLLSGKLVLKKGKNEFVKDDEKLVEYLKYIGANDFINIKETPKWADFKKTLKLSKKGTVLDSNGEDLSKIIKCVQHEDVFTVEVEKK